MNRDNILEIVINNIKLNVDGLEEVEIDPDKSILEYGASSLDLVEIVSSSVREIGIKVSRTELANLKSINDLVDLLTYQVNSAVSMDTDTAAFAVIEEAGVDGQCTETGWVKGEI